MIHTSSTTTVNVNPMANRQRSTLELMLDQILADHHPEEDLPVPALPVRPVSRARMPQARRPFRLFDGNRGNRGGDDGSSFESVGVNGGGVSVSERNQVDDGSNRNEELQNRQETAEKQVANIQKCYRGHRVRCNYRDIRRGVIALQSIARGENARREYGYRSERLKAAMTIQKHTRKYFQLRLQRQQHEADVSIQSGDDIKEQISGDDKSAISGVEREHDPDVKVGYSFIIDLHKRVLRTEATVRDKSAENAALKMKLEEMDRKWKESEERMKTLEKTWQDQLTYAQKCLAASKKNPGLVITFVRSDSVQERFDGDTESNVIRVPSGRSSRDFDHGNQHVNLDGDETERVSRKLHPGEELRKLKAKFKAWKKEYRNKLREAHSVFKKVGNAETGKSQRNSWWGRFSH